MSLWRISMRQVRSVHRWVVGYALKKTNVFKESTRIMLFLGLKFELLHRIKLGSHRMRYTFSSLLCHNFILDCGWEMVHVLKMLAWSIWCKESEYRHGWMYFHVHMFVCSKSWKCVEQQMDSLEHHYTCKLQLFVLHFVFVLFKVQTIEKQLSFKSTLLLI
jgi:hypothetical protein